MGALSIEPFVHFIERMTSDVATVTGRYYQMVLSEYSLAHAASLNQTDYKPVFSLIDQVLFVDCYAQADLIRYYLAPLGKLMLFSCSSCVDEKMQGGDEHTIGDEILKTFETEPAYWEMFFYCAVWKKYIGTRCPLQTEIVLRVNGGKNTASFIEVSNDDRFIVVDSTLSAEDCARLLTEADEMAPDSQTLISQLRKRLPLSKFTVKGFHIWYVRDITVRHLLTHIQQRIEAAGSDNQSITCSSDVLDVLEKATGYQGLHYGLYPLLQVNDRFTFDDPRDDEIVYPSILSGQLQRTDLYQFLEDVFRYHPRVIYLKDIAGKASRHAYLRMLEKKGIQTYALVPITFKGSLVGVLEIFTDRPEALPKGSLLKLELFRPVLGALFRNSIDRFNETLEHIVKDQYTALQPAVQWRFNEAAYNFMRSRYKTGQIEEISFDGVCPLYGAVDIRNSTANRNTALKEDFLFQLDKIVEVLEHLEQSTNARFINERILLCRDWIIRLNSEAGIRELGEAAYFLETEMLSYFKELESVFPAQGSGVRWIISEMQETESGSFTKCRRKLEHAMSAVITTVDHQVDLMKSDSLQNFPCFFEKFRTDGVEYDIYIGSSIAPQRKFSKLLVQNLRFLQLESMIRIVKVLQGLQARFETNVETTQLIFIHPYTIDIRFRRDERRFDVEGAYNIRYQIIKKRIDKALIKGSGERLVSPGKIAVVYFAQQDIDEFSAHIRYFQNKGDIEADIEFLGLEEMQGVTGMKAVRIGVRTDDIFPSSI